VNEGVCTDYISLWYTLVFIHRSRVRVNQSRSQHVDLHVEYAKRGKQSGSPFMFSLFCEYGHLECVHIHVIYRIDQAEYAIHILGVAPQEYVNIYSTRTHIDGRSRVPVNNRGVNSAQLRKYPYQCCSIVCVCIARVSV